MGFRAVKHSAVCKTPRRIYKLFSRPVTHARKRIYFKAIPACPSLPGANCRFLDSVARLKVIHSDPDPCRRGLRYRRAKIVYDTWGRRYGGGRGDGSKTIHLRRRPRAKLDLFTCFELRSATRRRYNRNRSRRQTRRTFVRPTVNITTKERHIRVLVCESDANGVSFFFRFSSRVRASVYLARRKQIYRVTGISNTHCNIVTWYRVDRSCRSYRLSLGSALTSAGRGRHRTLHSSFGQFKMTIPKRSFFSFPNNYYIKFLRFYQNDVARSFGFLDSKHSYRRCF